MSLVMKLFLTAPPRPSHQPTVLTVMRPDKNRKIVRFRTSSASLFSRRNRPSLLGLPPLVGFIFLVTPHTFARRLLPEAE